MIALYFRPGLHPIKKTGPKPDSKTPCAVIACRELFCIIFLDARCAIEARRTRCDAMPNSLDLDSNNNLSGEPQFVENKIMHLILADHHPQALWALKTTLQEKSNLVVIGEAKDAAELLAMVIENPPDLALIDWELPGKPIEDLITELHRCKPKPAVIVMGSQPEYGRMLLKAGADAFVSKSDQPDWLLETLQKFQRRTRNR